MAYSGINKKLDKDKSDDEDDEQNGPNKKKRTRKESPVSIKNNEKGSSSSSSKKKSHSSSEKKRSHNVDIADKDFNWNELELNSEIGSDHATEEVQQRTTTRKRKVNISEMFKPRKIECIRPGRGKGSPVQQRRRFTKTRCLYRRYFQKHCSRNGRIRRSRAYQ